MNSTKQLLLALLGIFAFFTISISEVMLEPPIDPTIWNFYYYPLILVISVIYLQWLLRAFVMPLSDLPLDDRKKLKEKIQTKHSKPTITFGYLVLMLYVVEFFFRTPSESFGYNLPLFAVVIIALGTLAEARALVQCLIQSHGHSRETRSNKPEMPTA